MLAELAEDRDRDGRAEVWQFFRGGDLVRLELDRDRDGKADWRETWKPDANRPPELQAQLIEGRWRIVPFNVFKSIQGQAPSPGFYAGKAEKLVGKGEWIDTFEDEQILIYGNQDQSELDDGNDGNNKPKVIRRSARWRFETGKPVEVTVTGEKHYTHVTWKDGRPTAYEDGVDKDNQRCIERYRDGMWITREYFDENGKPTTRLTGGGAAPRWEWFEGGKWTGDREETYRDPQGRITARTVYRDGRQSLQEIFEPNSGGALIRRTRYEADRGWVMEQAHPAAGHIFLRSRYAPDGKARGVEKLVDERWVRDFEDATWGEKQVYRDGRLVRLERTGALGDEGTRVAVFHEDGREEWGDGKVMRYWYAYSNEPGQVRRRLREARDLDGDGKPDLKVDYERLTVEQPAAPAG